MTIATLIDKFDNSEIIRDLIGSLLAQESAAQQVLATAAAKDPNDWKLRVFVERANPWGEFQESPDQADAAPIVNVSFDNSVADPAHSNIVERQKLLGLYNIDCYGYGISADELGDGHVAGDAKASMEAQRAAKLVRNILMAGEYTYLGLPRGATQFVWKRWVKSITVLHMPPEARAVQHVVCARVVFQVEFNEFSPQVQGEPLEYVSVTARNADTGEIYLVSDYVAE